MSWIEILTTPSPPPPPPPASDQDGYVHLSMLKSLCGWPDENIMDLQEGKGQNIKIEAFIVSLHDRQLFPFACDMEKWKGHHMIEAWWQSKVKLTSVMQEGNKRKHAGDCRSSSYLLPWPNKKKNHRDNASWDIEKSTFQFRRDASMREVTVDASRVCLRFRRWIEHHNSSILQDSHLYISSMVLFFVLGSTTIEELTR